MAELYVKHGFNDDKRFERRKLMRFRKGIAIVLSVLMVLGTSVTSFAETKEATNEPSTIEEAKVYLLNYCDVSINEIGREVKTTYEFLSAEQLNNAAIYIVENGLESFNEKLDREIKIALEKEKSSNIASYSSIPNLQNGVTTRESSPTSVTKTISGNGTHSVSGTTYGTAYFNTLGTGSYTAKISYKVVVSGGKISRISSGPTFSYTVGFSTMDINDISLSQTVNNYKVSVTSRYTVSKTVTLAGINVKSETDTDVFGVAAVLE